MIIVLAKNSDAAAYAALDAWLKAEGLDYTVTEGPFKTVLNVLGDTGRIDTEQLQSLDIVERVTRIMEPFMHSGKIEHPQPTVVDIGGFKLGGNHFQIIAGPCTIESENQLLSVANTVRACGVNILRGGAFKPRTSPYSFQGMREDGLEILLKVKERTGMAVVTEILDVAHLPLFENVDMLQVGARNMQNFELLRALGKTNKPILLKRSPAATLEELLLSAEYIISGGNENVVLCERGIRTFEKATRYTLDLSAVPLLKELSHLPVIVDPSHGTGISSLLKPMSLAATAAGSDGLMIEVHNNPAIALCDGPQAVRAEDFRDLSKSVEDIRSLLYQSD